MKIAFIITSLGMGGAQSQVCDLADQLAKNGHEVLIISMINNINSVPKDPRVKVESLNFKENLKLIIFSIFKAKKLLNDFLPDVIHSHMYHANIFSRLLSTSIPKTRLICTAHSTNEGGSARMFLYRITDFCCTLTTNVSDSAINSYVKKKAVPRKKIIKVTNGIDFGKYKFDYSIAAKVKDELSLNSQNKIIMSIGRLSEEKNLFNLINSLQSLRENFYLIIVGDGPLRLQLEEYATNKILGKFIFLGARNDIPALLSCADLLVLSSDYEGFPMAVGEAIATRCLVVATDAGGTREWFKNLDWIVPINNSEVLKDKIECALNLSEDQKKHHKEQNYSYIQEQFSLKSTVNKWLNIYKVIRG